MSARFLVGDVFERLAEIPDGSVDVIVTSPPFLALRSYLPADHPNKHLEIGSEPTPAEFIDTLLRLTAEWRRVLAPHGSLCVELGDTYAGSGGSGGDYDPGGFREGQPGFDGSARYGHKSGSAKQNNHRQTTRDRWAGSDNQPGWPLAKSKALIPELYRIGLAYGIHPLTGEPSPAGRWRVRNVVTWCRPNPPVGALGDKWRPATSDIVAACMSPKRYWDDLATRSPVSDAEWKKAGQASGESYAGANENGYRHGRVRHPNPAGAPLLDWWEIPPGGYPGSHYAVYPPAIVEPLIDAMCPQRVCRACGEPSRRLTETTNALGYSIGERNTDNSTTSSRTSTANRFVRETGATTTAKVDLGWTDCGHDDWRPGVVLDPFGGSGTTGMVATGRGHDAILIDLDERNADLAVDRIGPLLLEVEYPNPTHTRVP